MPTRNINRGRDHGINGYNKYRELVGLKKAATFNDFPEMSSENVLRLKKSYLSVDDIDLFTGGYCEKPVIGGVVGPTFAS